MNETTVYALPADWPQPEFVLGEQVYVGRSGVAYRKNEPVMVRGIFLDYDEHERPTWLYDAGGFRNLARDLSREPWTEPAQLKSFDVPVDDDLYELP